MILNLFFIIVIILILVVVPIYDSYKAYTILDNNKIKNFDNFKDFLKFMFERLKLWIECNILGFFSRDYIKKCFTDSVVLSQNDEQRLNSATPGSLGEALWELRADQARQSEDYLRANEALDALENSIINRDAYQIFSLSDEVEMDEEALYWRAWITAQASQMTHNLVNLEKCDSNGVVKDYMDLAATGLDKDGNPIESHENSGRKFKSANEFKWSNRCMNTNNISFATSVHCQEIQDPFKDKYWVEEKVRRDLVPGTSAQRCSGSGCRDSSGLDSRSNSVHNDLQSFHLGNFSGYNCKLYETLYCRDGYPDYDNYADMFGVNYNWPEFNCCACGGGDRGDVDDVDQVETSTIPKQKYEMISSIPTTLKINASSVSYDDSVFNFRTLPTPENNSMKDCMNACTNDDNCLGLAFENCGFDPQEVIYRENSETIDKINPHSLSEGSNVNSPFLYNPGTCKLILGDPSNCKLNKNLKNCISAEKLFNRNELNEKALLTPQFTQKTEVRMLKKMPEDFLDTNNSGNILSEDISSSEDISNGYKDYSIPYDVPIKNVLDSTGNIMLPVNNCGDLCMNLPGYKTTTAVCTAGNCRRSECCELNPDENSTNNNRIELVSDKLIPKRLLRIFNRDDYCNLKNQGEISSPTDLDDPYNLHRYLIGDFWTMEKTAIDYFGHGRFRPSNIGEEKVVQASEIGISCNPNNGFNEPPEGLQISFNTATDINSNFINPLWSFSNDCADPIPACSTKLTSDPCNSITDNSGVRNEPHSAETCTRNDSNYGYKCSFQENSVRYNICNTDSACRVQPGSLSDGGNVGKCDMQGLKKAGCGNVARLPALIG